MALPIGANTCRIDNRPDVVGNANETTELDILGLAHASLVCATTAPGRIAEIDASDALRVKGIVSVLTHQNSSPLPFDHRSVDETLSPGASYSPFSTDEVRFHGQPVALVLANTPTAARLAASLIRVEYHEQDDLNDVDLPRARSTPLLSAPESAGTPGQTIPMATIAHRARGHHPSTTRHNSRELTSTAIFEEHGKISLYDDTGAMQSWHRYLHSRLASGLPPPVLVMLTVLAALTLQRSVRIMLTHQQMNDLACAPA